MKPRVIIELAGGLGNQMFQYAFFLQMQHLGYPCKFYFDQSQFIHNGPEIDRVFDLHLPMATDEELDRVLGRNKNIFSRITRKLGRQASTTYWEHDKGYRYKPELFIQVRPVYLQGCWLSPLYFRDIEAQVRKAFRFPEINDAENKEMAELIKHSACSVAVHARFGDYLSSATHLNLDYRDYVEKAIHRLPGTVSRDFFIFSDDIGQAKSTLEGMMIENSRIHFISGNHREQSWKDMVLMSMCHHQVIANSTFSWWAAWLNDNPEKIVIAPKNWFTKKEWNLNDMLPAEWIKI